MKGDFKTLIDELRALLHVLQAAQVYDCRPPARLLIHEPAPAIYDCPRENVDWQPLRPGDLWGGKNRWSWMRAEVGIPREWEGRKVELLVRHTRRYLETVECGPMMAAGPEGRLFVDGRRAGALDAGHDAVRLPLRPGRDYDLRAAIFAGRVECRHVLESFELRCIDPSTEALYHDLRVLLDLLQEMPADHGNRGPLLDIVAEGFNRLDLRELNRWPVPEGADRDPRGERFYPSVDSAREWLSAAIDNLPDQDVPVVHAVGHAHIDLAWLWPIRCTRHKIVNTFATQARLLDDLPGWFFQQSSPQAYYWLEQDAPDLFEDIVRLVREGRWEADGAMWCEADTNLPCGESLVRQLLYGKTYWNDKFAFESRMLWLPDVFGYTAALPQLLRLAGVESFVTSKLSWNQFNRFPHDTFRWRGLDGSEVPVHFITTPCKSWFLTYNATLTVNEVKGSWNLYRQKESGCRPLMSFGYGDGGGGPTREMVETGRRINRFASRAGLPTVRFDQARELMGRVSADAGRLPVWDGELYLEYHRGTYTTQAWLKRANRKNEVRLQRLEWLAALLPGEAAGWDAAAVGACWRDLLLCQFHDILPGSSVGETYDDEIRPIQERIARELDGRIEQAVRAIGRKASSARMQEPVLLVNTLAWERNDPVTLPDGRRRRFTVPAGGWTVVDAVDGAPGDPVTVTADGLRLENGILTVDFNRQGEITGLYDHVAQRDVLLAGRAANSWQLFRDRPAVNDAWDIEYYYQQRPLPGPECVGCRVLESGPHRVAVEWSWRLEKPPLGKRSTIKQVVEMFAGDRLLVFDTEADWYEHHQLLKVAFPVDIRALDAAYEIQFGHLRRPTHRNTAWDFARFECCAQRFVDLSEHGYGVALLNDCKYGHDVHENTMRITCIKCPASPDRLADRGKHRFRYGLLPHPGTLQQAEVPRRAAEFNNPALVEGLPAGRRGSRTQTGWRCGGDGVLLETVKPAEDGRGVILRLYEAYGGHSRAVLDLPLEPSAVRAVDLLERPVADAPEVRLDGNRAELALKPFQIVSLRVLP